MSSYTDKSVIFSEFPSASLPEKHSSHLRESANHLNNSLHSFSDRNPFSNDLPASYFFEIQISRFQAESIIRQESISIVFVRLSIHSSSFHPRSLFTLSDCPLSQMLFHSHPPLYCRQRLSYMNIVSSLSVLRWSR